MKKYLFLVGLFINSFAFAQPAKYTLTDCEQAFVKNNLLLLAAQYNIQSQQALVIQAKIWDNPIVSLESNAIDPSNNRFFNVGKQGEKMVSIQQLILLGGKRKHHVDMAKSNAKIAVLAYEDLLRGLKYQLRLNFYALYFDYKTLNKLNVQIEQIEELVDKYDIQVAEGNIAKKELVRLRSLLLSLKNERADLLESILDEERLLALIMGLENDFDIAPTAQELEHYFVFKSVVNEELYNTALANRPDLKVEKEHVTLAESNFKLQKAMRIPDLTLGAGYDQRGGAFNNQTDITLSMPLIVWNRNQGNIKSSEIELKSAQSSVRQKEIAIAGEVRSGYKKYLEAWKNYPSNFKKVVDDFSEIDKGVFENFQKRNISLMEFTDFIESYNQSVFQLNISRKNIIRAQEEINYITSSNVF